jgi:hypothetical protein
MFGSHRRRLIDLSAETSTAPLPAMRTERAEAVIVLGDYTRRAVVRGLTLAGTTGLLGVQKTALEWRPEDKLEQITDGALTPCASGPGD